MKKLEAQDGQTDWMQHLHNNGQGFFICL